jgi:hypothetical protein
MSRDEAANRIVRILQEYADDCHLPHAVRYGAAFRVLDAVDHWRHPHGNEMGDDRAGGHGKVYG